MICDNAYPKGVVVVVVPTENRAVVAAGEEVWYGFSIFIGSNVNTFLNNETVV
jgi:hypothetical protein